ncbi:MAG TPA: NAD(P)/FAD-dependent oxidoreductase, partial [Bacteroidota bacterium]|nr:NAD(P)/FAD-dependent oxidoreductase [Bacteroidota bacterium]
MADFAYLIIGGGMTADAAVRGIRMTDTRGRIGILCEEPDPPYNRPPLSKGLWKGEPLDGVWCKTPGENLDLFLSTKAVSIDPEKKLVVDAGGESYSYDALLIATGGRPRRLESDGGGILYYRTLADYRSLRRLCESGNAFTVIGGGFIGAEVAAALALNGKSVTMVIPREAIGGRAYPLPLGKFLNGYYREKGVDVLAGESVTAVEKRGTRFIVRTTGSREIHSDGVVAGIGIEPNMEIAARAGLATGNGIRVDEFLRTSHPEIYAAGDVAGFFSVPLGHNV